MKNRLNYLVVFVAGAMMLGWTACNSDDPEQKADDTSDQVTNTQTDIALIPNEYTGYSWSVDDSKIAKGNNQFAFDLLKLINGDISESNDKNIFFSPMSLTMCLSMLTNGAQGETQSELLNLLHQDDLTTLNTTNAKLLDVMPGLDNTTQISFANGIWACEEYPLRSDYIATNAEWYKAQISNFDCQTTDIVSIINQWVSDNTNGMIPDMLDSNCISPIYLVDAVYFKAIWNEPFESTIKRKFTNYDNSLAYATFMSFNNRTSGYTETDKCQYIELPFGNGAFTCGLALPKDGYSIADIADDYESWYKVSENANVSLTMPRIAISSSYEDLVKYLYKLGLN